MEEVAQQFDSSHGGHQFVPNAFKVSDFLKDRMEEIVMLTETMKESPFRGQTFQRLPKHMRRRQMSHYIKRLPRKLQRPYMMSLKDGLPVPTKCPSRKYRRRPSNLLLEYNRRQREFVWLETHIWHAKRFHMTKKWGYKLPEKPTNKSFRACYRAISEHCLVTDISYYNCIELKGQEKELLEGLQQCTSPDCNLTFAAKTYLKGTREGSVTIFHPNSYPNKVIGCIKFLWKPISVSDKDRKIWIWVHPLMHNEVVECFKNLFNLTTINKISNRIGMPANEEEENKVEVLAEPKSKRIRRKKDKISKKRIEQIKLEPKNVVPFNKMPKYVNEDESISMTLLKDSLNRFQLTGPLSQAVISQAFNIIQVYPMELCNKSTERENAEEEEEVVFIKTESKKRKSDCIIDEPNKKTKTISDEKMDVFVEEENKWWEEYYKEEIFKSSWISQRDFYEKLSNCSKPTDAPSGLILSLVIGDPRLKTPSRREKAVSKTNEPCQILDNPSETDLSLSPIWNPKVRDQVSTTKLTTQEINEFRSKKIVPGFDVDDIIPDGRQSRIPILLIQRPGVRDGKAGRIGLGSGWDVISPAGFGLPIWLALIFRGARSGGLRETELTRLECNNLIDCIQPDSAAGKIESDSKCEELKSVYFKKPPGKRPNFIKLGIPCPFSRPWNALVADWIRKTDPDSLKSENGEFKVLRSRKSLEEINRIFSLNLPKGAALDFDDLLRKIGFDFLVPVSIECSWRGRPEDMALICLPKENDLKDHPSGNSGPKESPHRDGKENLRKAIKSNHSKLLKSTRRKRRKEKLAAQNCPNPSKISERDSDESKREHKSKMESLWMPADPEEVDGIVDFSTRRIMGFVVMADFTFSKSVPTALGYVTVLGLRELIKVSANANSKPKILIRNRNQSQYRFGKLRIIEE